MSYLQEILSSVEEVEIEQINIKCPEIVSAVDLCKSNVLTFVENVYVKFREVPKKNKLLANKLSAIQDEVTTLTNNIQNILRKDLSKAESELNTHLESLVKCNVSLQITDSLYKIHRGLLEIKELKEKRAYFSRMEKILETSNFINSIPFTEELTIIEELDLMLNEEKASLLNELFIVFKENVILEPSETKSVLKIKNEENILIEVLSSLYLYKTSVTVLDHVTNFLWNHVFVPIVDYTTEIKTTFDDGFVIMEVITVDPNKKSSYAEVFANIKIVLNFLLSNFTITLSEDLTSLSYVGRDIKDNLSELIIKHCLRDTIPSTKEDLDKYSIVIEATEDLEQALTVAGIFTEDTASILEYTNNIDVLFVEKKCQNYLAEAQTFMKKDLHNLVEVGEVQESQSLELSRAFPRCSVSSGVLDLVRLLEGILAEATSAPAACQGRLLLTVQNICQTYALFVPTYHKKMLQTIPQQMAVFYNNCMYIAHQLMNLEGKDVGNEERHLQEVASNMFTRYVHGQVKQIEEAMKGAALHQQTLQQVEPSAEKCLRQCLRQQELLRTVWHKVLPYSVYNKSLGAMLDSLCGHIVDAVVRCVDISTDAAEQLAELIKMVQVRGPKLFTDPKEVALYVGSWYRLNELGFVLNANMLDINDRWADGKGPLGLQFKPEELRQLVRALFQNTERRAALLAKIRD